MAKIQITFGPHPLAPAGTPPNTMSVDEDQEIEVMAPKASGPTLKRAGDVAPPDRICYAGHCLPVQ